MVNPITVAQQATGIVQSVSNTIGGIGSALGRLSTGSFWDQLKPASYRGIPFNVLASEATIGRKNAVHDYPLRDGAWVEDMGATAPRLHLHGFLIGDDCIAQRAAMIRVMNAGGTGPLVHPSLGNLNQVSLAECTFTERMERGRVIEMDMTFIDGIQRIYPTIGINTPGVVVAAANAASTSAAASFVKTVLGAAQAAVSLAQGVVANVEAYVQGVQGAVQNVASLWSAVSTLPGALGRQFRALTDGFASFNTGNPGSTATVQSLEGQTAAAHLQTQAAVQSLQTAAATFAASTLTPYTTAVQSLAQAVLAAASTPRDAIDVFAAMTVMPALPYQAPGTTAYTVQGAQSDLFRRAAVIALAQASSRYQPSNADDALALRDQVTTLLDLAITTAGNQGNDATYLALRTLRAAVVQDLNTRGALLPGVVTITTPSSLPALALAQRLYRDAKRSDELVAEASPRHPAFMPTTFRGLAA